MLHDTRPCAKHCHQTTLVYSYRLMEYALARLVKSRKQGADVTRLRTPGELQHELCRRAVRAGDQNGLHGALAAHCAPQAQPPQRNAQHWRLAASRQRLCSRTSCSSNPESHRVVGEQTGSARGLT